MDNESARSAMPSVYREKAKQIARRRNHACHHAHSVVVKEAAHQYVQSVTHVTKKKKKKRAGKSVTIYVSVSSTTKTVTSST